MIEVLVAMFWVVFGWLASFSYGKTCYYKGIIEGLKQGESLCQKHHGTNVFEKKE